MNLNEAKDYSMDNGRYPVFFSTQVGLDFKLKSNPEYYPKCNNPRRVVIRVSSFIGICGGARHYYATIEADGISICYDKQTESGIKTWTVSGYLGEEFKKLPSHIRDLYSSKYIIDVCRRVTTSDIQKDPHRWEGYEVGDKTSAFDTRSSAISKAKAIVKARFSTGWQVEVRE